MAAAMARRVASKLHSKPPTVARTTVFGDLLPLHFERQQARTQDFAQEGPPALEGPPGYPGAPLSTRDQETRGPRMTAGAHWVIRGPSGNQGYMNKL